MQHNNLDHNSINGAILSVGTYILSISNINMIASFIFMTISGIASVSTIYYNFQKIKKEKNEKS